MEVVASLNELKKHTKLRVDVGSEPVLLTYLDGSVYAMSDRCPHFKASLFKGSFNNGLVTCPKDNAVIDVKNVTIVETAHLGPIKMPTKKAKVYQVSVEGDDIFVTL